MYSRDKSCRSEGDIRPERLTHTHSRDTQPPPRQRPQKHGGDGRLGDGFNSRNPTNNVLENHERAENLIQTRISPVLVKKYTTGPLPVHIPDVDLPLSPMMSSLKR